MQTPTNPSQKISVILPVFNGGRYLLPAIRSILNQSYQDWEIILMDDGSTDDAVAGVRSLNDSRIKIYQDGINKGLAARLNEAVDLATGYYIARMDADDLCFPERFEKQVSFLQEHEEVDLLSTKVIVFKSHTNVLLGCLPHKEHHAEIVHHPWRGMYMPHPTWMGRAVWFRTHRYANPEVLRAEDQELLLRAYPTANYHSLNDVLLAYRQGDFNLSKTLIARQSLLHTQLALFSARQQWGNWALAVCATLAKIGVDLLAAVPRWSWFYFKRMSVPPGANYLEQFAMLSKRTGNSS